MVEATLPCLSAEALIERLETALAEEPDGVLAFDADGTLWSGDIGDELFFIILRERGVGEPACAALRRIAGAHDVDPSGDGSALAARVFAAFQEGRVPEATVCEVLAWICAGARREEVERITRGVVERADLTGRVRPEVARVIRWAGARGVPCYVVSASPRHAVAQAAPVLGLDPAYVIATTPRFRDDVMLADVERPIPFGPGKAALLRQRTEAVVLAAFGDSDFDSHLLAASRVPVAVRPKRSLRALAGRIAGLIELAPGPA